MYLSHKVILWCPSILHQCLSPFVYMLWSNFILGLNYLFFCFKLIIIHYHTQKQKKRKFKPMIKLNYNIYNIIKQQFVVTAGKQIRKTLCYFLFPHRKLNEFAMPNYVASSSLRSVICFTPRFFEN